MLPVSHVLAVSHVLGVSDVLAVRLLADPAVQTSVHCNGVRERRANDTTLGSHGEELGDADSLALDHDLHRFGTDGMDLCHGLLELGIRFNVLPVDG